MKNFEDFWPFYLNEHSNPINRKLHFVGTLILHLILLYVFFTGQIKLMIYIPFVGYGFAWYGHFFIEKNRPATFKYPLWSLVADFKMFYFMLLKKI